MVNSMATYVRYNIKVALRINFICSVTWVILSFFTINYEYLDFRRMAGIAENYLSIAYVIAVPVALIYDIEELSSQVLKQQKHPFIVPLVYKLMLNIVGVTCITSIPVVVAKLQNGEFIASQIIFGMFITGFVLISLCIFIWSITKRITAGYIVTAGYFLFEFVTKGKYTKDLFMFSLCKGAFEMGKVYLLGIGVLLLSIGIVLLRKQRIVQ